MRASEQIVNAARRLFVQQGFAATSLDQIAALAKVLRGSIFYSFPSKSQLWHAVKHAIVNEAGEQQPELPPLNLPFADFIHQLLFDSIRLYRHNPDLIQMLNWQRIENRNHDIGIIKYTHIQQWIDAFKHYQSTGDIANTHKPEFILTFVFSIASTAALDPNTFIAKPADFDAYLDFCTTQICCGLKQVYWQ